MERVETAVVSGCLVPWLGLAKHAPVGLHGYAAFQSWYSDLKLSECAAEDWDWRYCNTSRMRASLGGMDAFAALKADFQAAANHLASVALPSSHRVHACHQLHFFGTVDETLSLWRFSAQRQSEAENR
jgi:hypothetical protein